MKRALLIIGVSLFFSYGYSQNIDKTNKKFEAFLAEHAKNENYKLKEYVFKIDASELKSKNVSEFFSILNNKEGIIDYYIDKTNSYIHLYYVNNLDEGIIQELIQKGNFSSAKKIKNEYINIK
jgi:hypothetical protein